MGKPHNDIDSEVDKSFNVRVLPRHMEQDTTLMDTLSVSYEFPLIKATTFLPRMNYDRTLANLSPRVNNALKS